MKSRSQAMSTAAFTGHRPEKINIPENEVITWLDEMISQAVTDGYTTFISGMQRGVDIWAAELVLWRRELDPSIKLIAASAFSGMEKDWNDEWKSKYRDIIQQADEVTYVSQTPGRKAFRERDHWMVDCSDLLIAMYCGVPGGTEETVKYAEAKGKMIS